MPRDAWGGGYPLTPSKAPSQRPATVLWTQVPASMAFVTTATAANRFGKPPPTACPTASGAVSEVPSLLMHPWLCRHGSAQHLVFSFLFWSEGGGGLRLAPANPLMSAPPPPRGAASPPPCLGPHVGGGGSIQQRSSRNGYTHAVQDARLFLLPAPLVHFLAAGSRGLTALLLDVALRSHRNSMDGH